MRNNTTSVMTGSYSMVCNVHSSPVNNSITTGNTKLLPEAGHWKHSSGNLAHDHNLSVFTGTATDDSFNKHASSQLAVQQRSLMKRSHHTHRTTSKLTSFYPNWVAMSALWSDPVCHGCNQSEWSRLHCLVWLVTATANRVASQHTHCHSVQMKQGHISYIKHREGWKLAWEKCMFQVICPDNICQGWMTYINWM